MSSESPLVEEYNKPKENILSTKKTPEDIRKMIESNGIDVQDIIELKAERDKMKMELKAELKAERQKIMNELGELETPEKPDKPRKPEVPGKPDKPEVPGKPAEVIDSTPDGNVTPDTGAPGYDANNVAPHTQTIDNTAIEPGQYTPGVDGVAPASNSGIPINPDPRW